MMVQDVQRAVAWLGFYLCCRYQTRILYPHRETQFVCLKGNKKTAGKLELR